MSGGPSQIDTFDPKPGHANGGPFKEIATRVPGLRIAEHLPKLADQAEHLAIIRSMTSKEGDHARATQFVHTGYLPLGADSLSDARLAGLQGARIDRRRAAQLCQRLSRSAPSAPPPMHPAFSDRNMPRCWSTADRPPAGTDADVDAALKVEDLELPKGVSQEVADTRLDLLGSLNDHFVAEHADCAGRRPRHRLSSGRQIDAQSGRPGVQSRRRAGRRPRCLRPQSLWPGLPAGPPAGRTRRAVCRSHASAMADSAGTATPTISRPSKSCRETLDPAWATLIEDLRTRGLLDTTLIVWMGEFGRTPKINDNTGRDHFPNAWSTVLAGGGIRGGQAHGRTSDDAMSVADNPVTVPDLLATVCRALGIDPQNRTTRTSAGRFASSIRRPRRSTGVLA